MERKLTVKRERLIELSNDELQNVVAAGDMQQISLTTCLATLHGCTTAIECP